MKKFFFISPLLFVSESATSQVAVTEGYLK
jgi:hypothetical protein